MNVGDYSLSSVLIAFERTLKIEYDVTSITSILSTAEARLRDEIGIDIKGDLSTRLEDAPTDTIKAMVETLFMNIQEHLKAISLIQNVSIFTKSYPFHLKQVSWLGFDSSQCLVAFQYLIHKDTYAERDSFFEKLIGAAEYLTMGSIKRVLIILAMLERIGVHEGTSILAQYIYASSAYEI